MVQFLHLPQTIRRSALHGQHEAGESVVVSPVDVNVRMLQQELDDVRMAATARVQQRSAT